MHNRWSEALGDWLANHARKLDDTNAQIKRQIEETDKFLAENAAHIERLKKEQDNG